MDTTFGFMALGVYITVAAIGIGILIVIYKIAKLIINYLRDKHGLDRV